MFVEHLSWVVPPAQRDSAVDLLSTLHHHMDASGGLVRSLSGHDVYNPNCLVSLTFWKSWEDLARFLASPRSSILSEQRANSAERPKPHHFELLWDWPQEAADTLAGESYWAIYDFYATRERLQALLEGLQHYVPALAGRQGFRSAALWLDKNNDCHVALATQWADRTVPDIQLPENIRDSGGQTIRSIVRARVTDQYHLGVV